MASLLVSSLVFPHLYFAFSFMATSLLLLLSIFPWGLIAETVATTFMSSISFNLHCSEKQSTAQLNTQNCPPLSLFPSASLKYNL